MRRLYLPVPGSGASVAWGQRYVSLERSAEQAGQARMSALHQP